MPGVTTAYQNGIHSARPAASAGCILYACSTHSLIYRSDGSSWTTWMTIGSSTTTVASDAIWDAAGDLAVGTGADTAAKLSLTAPAANILNVLGVANGETTPTWKAIHDGTAPTTQAFGDSATAGTSLLAAHRDHKHGMPAKPTPSLILDYAQSADISGISLGLSTWTDILANMNFTVANAASLVEIIVRGVAIADGAVGTPTWLIRAVIDSAGTPINVQLSGTPLTATTPVNPHAGSTPVFLSGLSAATHTIKLQGWSGNPSGTPKYYCRPTTQTPQENLFIQIIEHL